MDAEEAEEGEQVRLLGRRGDPVGVDRDEFGLAESVRQGLGIRRGIDSGSEIAHALEPVSDLGGLDLEVWRDVADLAWGGGRRVGRGGGGGGGPPGGGRWGGWA